MTPDEHLDKIVAKCRANIKDAERMLPHVWEAAVHIKDRIAGWRSTIAAIEGLRYSVKRYSEDAQEFAYEQLDFIRAAWPKELL